MLGRKLAKNMAEHLSWCLVTCPRQRSRAQGGGGCEVPLAVAVGVLVLEPHDGAGSGRKYRVGVSAPLGISPGEVPCPA